MCLPYAGGSAAVFHGWADDLPNIDVCAAELPGRGTRFGEPHLERLVDIVDGLMHALTPLIDRPIAFFGHSMGALIAFELARACRRRLGVETFHLFASGFRAPQEPSRSPSLHALPAAEFRKRVGELNGTPPEILGNDELMDLVMPALRADFAAVERHGFVADRPLDCPVSVFGGIDDPVMRRDQLKGWREHTRGPFALRLFEGDHFFLHGARSKIVRSVAGSLMGGRP